MTAVRISRLSRPGVLESIDPERLFALLHPYADFFANRSVQIEAPGSIDCQAVIREIAKADRETPADLLDAISLIDELANTVSVDLLLDRVPAQNLGITPCGKHSSADIVTAAWLSNPEKLVQTHALSRIKRVRSYDYFQASQTTAPKFVSPAKETIQQLERDIDSWHVERFRAQGTRVEVFENADEVEFSIMHGSLFRRQRIVENGRFGFHSFWPVQSASAIAGKILWLTLKMEWQRGVAFLQSKWLDFKGFFIGIFQTAVYSVAGLMTDAWAGLQTGWLETTHFIADSWTILISLLQKGWNRFSGFFQKVWARIQGLFGDTNAEAEIAKINDEIARQDDLINNAQNQTILDREQQRLKARNKIEQDRLGAQSALGDMQAQEQSALEAANQKALADSAAELDKAKAEWKAALGEAAAKRAETSPGSPSQFSLSGLDLPSVDGLDQTLAETKKKTDVVGTFNPIAAMNLGADSLGERTARASEEVAANTKKLVQQADRGGLVFG